MPELPEVHTTSTQLQKVLPGLEIAGIWSDLQNKNYEGKESIKNAKYFNAFKKEILHSKITSVSRRGKNILIHLSSENTILIHMKMTGHLLYGKYEKIYDRQTITNQKIEKWIPAQEGALNDPYNRFVHFIISLSNGKHLAFSDTRKFGKIVLIKNNYIEQSPHLGHLGPDPLDQNFKLKDFKIALYKKNSGKVKQVLMDQTIIAGIGNIYSDELLWLSDIHPETKIKCLSENDFKKMYLGARKVLNSGINFGGDSMSDYRNIYGEKGGFQTKHNVYQRAGEKCRKKNCTGIIKKIKVGGRSASYCPVHQEFKKC